MELALQILSSVLTIFTFWKMGDRSVWGPILGLVTQALFVAVVWMGGLWGLFPATVFIAAVHGRNLWKWHQG